MALLNDQLVNTWMLSPNTLEGIFLATNWHDVGHEWGMTCSFQITTPQSSESHQVVSVSSSLTVIRQKTRCLCCLSPTQLPVPTSKLLIFWDANALPKFNLEPKNDGLQKESTFWCHFQVNHVKLWEGTTIFVSHSWLQLFPSPSITFLDEGTWKTCFLERPSAPAM